MKKVWHHGAWNRNFGDWVLFDSIHSNLDKAYGGSLSYVPVDSQKTIYDVAFIERLNAEADLLLIGGGGLIFNRPEDKSVSGWQFNIRMEDIDKIDIPIVIYGIGYNKFFYDDADFPEVLNRHLKAVQKRSVIFSVRNRGTYDELVRRGLDAERISIVPDAGIFAPCRRPDIGATLKDKLVIGLNIAGDRPAHRYPQPTEENERRCIEVLSDALRSVCSQENAVVLLLPHIMEIDESYDAFIKERVGGQRVMSLKEIAPELYPPASSTASSLVGAYDMCDMVIGGRGHACLIPFGRKKPFVAFGSHKKNLFLLKDVGIENAIISPNSILNGSLDASSIADMMVGIINDSTIMERISGAVAAEQKMFDDLNRSVVDILKKGGK